MDLSGSAMNFVTGNKMTIKKTGLSNRSFAETAFSQSSANIQFYFLFLIIDGIKVLFTITIRNGILLMPRHNILKSYDKLKKAGKCARCSTDITDILNIIYQDCLTVLNSTAREDLRSLVANKNYFAFNNGQKLSRAINNDLYDPNLSKWNSLLSAMRTNDLSQLNAQEITKILYTAAISFCAFVDLIKDGDQKTTGTFFEYFIAYFFSWRVGVEPQCSIQVLNFDGEDTVLNTDFIFNLGQNQRKFHMPIKTSTREHSIMLWAHQKLLDGVYGTERFMGTPVLLTETKTSKVKKEVVEICLPDQWRVYQLYIAKLKRIYYLDVPEAYKTLSTLFPPLVVKPFGEFFFEWSQLTPS